MVADGVLLPSLAPTLKSVPLPLSAIACGLPAALSVMLKLPDCAPVASGENVIENAHASPGASDAGQLLIWAKPLEIAIPDIASASLPPLVRGTFCASLVVPTC